MPESVMPFAFLRPLWLLGLIPALLLCGYLYRHHRQHSGWDALLPANLRKALLQHQTGRHYMGRYLLLACVWSLSLVILAGPAWESDNTQRREDSGSLILVLQVSRSMLSNDLPPTRLEQAKRKIRDLLQRYPDRRVALIAYAGSAHLVAPLTRDHGTLRNLLDALHPDIMPVRGQQLDQALQLAADMRSQRGDSATQVLLLASSIEGVSSDSLSVSARELGAALRIIGIGTADGAPIPLAEGGFMRDDQGRILLPRLDEQAMLDFARSEGGDYRRLSADERDLQQLLADTSSQPSDVGLSVQRQDQGHWLLLLLLPLAALGARRGWLLLILCALWLPLPANALGWQDLWQRPDQQASALLQAGQAAEAAGRFEDPQWRAWALLQAGDYRAAADAWGALANAEPDNAHYHFSQGTALALAEDYQGALLAFEATLTQAPDHTAARHNRQQVEAYLASLQEQADPDEESAQEQPANENAEPDTQPGGNNPGEAEVDGASDSGQASSGESSSAGSLDPAASNQGSSSGESQGQSTGALPGELIASPEDAGDATQHGGSGGGGSSRQQIEQQQAVQQWLRDIPDNPAELLRRKFLYQHLQQPDGRPR
ncbi:VWA domain-containing protein [Halopseudomonas pachastrellae]|uniref:VWA domain-containing protein n=1 Tax=Halopseudomonas pachastrellae TaxID=254161 RepID=UPI003D7ECBDB